MHAPVGYKYPWLENQSSCILDLYARFVLEISRSRSEFIAMAAEVAGWEEVQKVEAEESRGAEQKPLSSSDVEEISKSQGCDSRAIDATKEANKNTDNNTAVNEEQKEKQGESSNITKGEGDDDEKLQCHDSSDSSSESKSKPNSGDDTDKGSKSGSEQGKSKKKFLRKKQKKRAAKGAVTQEASELNVEEVKTEEENLECHHKSDSSDSKSSKSSISSKSDTDSKSDASSKSNSGSSSGSKKSKGKKKGLQQKEEESSTPQKTEQEENKQTEDELHTAAIISTTNSGNKANSGEKKKGILGRIMEKIPVYGKNVGEENTSVGSTEAN